jgi:hypothetical protein
MSKEKSEWEWITYLWDYAGYHLFSRAKETMVARSEEWEPEWYAVMNEWMFHKQTHICKTRKELWRKIKHNKDAKKLCQIFNRDFI